MHGVVSLLDSRHAELVKILWQLLEKHCGMNGVMLTPYPHFSWQIAEDYPEPATETLLKTISSQCQPLRVRTGGLGVFSGPHPVLFISIIRNEELNRVHKYIWQKFQKSAKGRSPFYAPPSWMPHITLAFGDATPRKLSCAVELLASKVFDWEIEVNNLAFIAQPGDQTGTLKHRYDFLRQ